MHKHPLALIKSGLDRLALKASVYFIWVVQAIDIYWNTIARDYLAEFELNPLAGWIIAKWGVATLSALKVIGTLIATEFVQSKHCPRRVWVLGVLVSVHVGLLAILTC